MADSDSSAVSVVAIIAILILVGLAVYFMFLRHGSNDAELKVDVSSSVLVQPATTAPTFLA